MCRYTWLILSVFICVCVCVYQYVRPTCVHVEMEDKYWVLKNPIALHLIYLTSQFTLLWSAFVYVHMHADVPEHVCIVLEARGQCRGISQLLCCSCDNVPWQSNLRELGLVLAYSSKEIHSFKVGKTQQQAEKAWWLDQDPSFQICSLQPFLWFYELVVCSLLG